MMTMMRSGNFACPAVRRTGLLQSCPRRKATALTKKPSTVATVRSWILSSSLRDDAEFSDVVSSQLVDKGMPVLWRRVLEVKVAECNWSPATEEWEEECVVVAESIWEPQDECEEGGRGSRSADACELAGVLRAFLTSSRPGVAVGLAAVFMLSVPTSFAIAACRLLVESWASLLLLCNFLKNRKNENAQ